MSGSTRVVSIQLEYSFMSQHCRFVIYVFNIVDLMLHVTVIHSVHACMIIKVALQFLQNLKM